MKITKEIRTRLAIQLTAKALRKHGKALGKQATKINQALEDAHRAYLAKAMPEVPPARYGDLISCGVFTSTTHGAESVYWPKKDNKGNESHVCRSPGLADVARVAKDAGERVWRELKNTDSWAAIGKLLYVWEDYSSNLRLKFTPSLSSSLPDFQQRHTVRLHYIDKQGHGDLEPHAVEYLKQVKGPFEEADVLGNKVADILREGMVYHGEVTDLLAACSTRKQLEELFPEAAALLPAPEPKRNALVPTDLAAKVRQRLKDGVPE